MSEDLHDIDKLFQESIEGHAEAPPPLVWEQLDKKLDQKKVASIAGRYNKLKWVAAALFLISLSMAAMWVYHLRRDERNSGLVRKDRSSQHANGLPRLQTEQAPLQNSSTSSDDRGNEVREQAGVNDSLQRNERVIPPSSQGKEENPPIKGESTDVAGQKTANNQQLKKEEQLIGRKESFEPAGRNLSVETGSGRQTAAANREKNKKVTGRGAKEEAIQPSLIVKDGKQDRNNNLSTAVQEEAPLRNAFIAEPGALADHTDVDASRLPLLAYRSLMPDLAAAPTPVRLTPVPAFTATVFFSPNLVSTRIADNRIMNFTGGPPNRAEDKKEIKDKEQTRSSKSFGVQLDYHINPHWSVGSGLVISSRITDIKAKPIYGHFDSRGGEINYQFYCSSGYSSIKLKTPGTNPPYAADTAQAVSSSNKLKYLSVPLIVKYSFGQGKFQFITGAGLQANFLTVSTIETQITKGTVQNYANMNEIQGLRSMYFSGILTAGVSYRLNRILSASVMPTAQLGFTSINQNQNAPVKSYINFYGLALGIGVKL
ncbi:MAG: PorT family protein [Williamsia sp.]|nr:PorT family protein [Williamsia sp.]